MATFQEELNDNIFRTIFDDLVTKLADDNTEVEIYRNEFLDPNLVKELAARYGVKTAFLVDIEDVTPLAQGQSLDTIDAIVTIVIYVAYPDYRDFGEGVKSSFSAAMWGARRLVATRLGTGTDHSDGAYTFVEIQKEDQIPYLHVHALRVAVETTISFHIPD